MHDQIINDHELTEQQKDSMLVLYALGQGNPGAYTVIAKLYNLVEIDSSNNTIVSNFIRDALINNISGSRLWYIFKNEANNDINTLISLNLSLFTDEYFYEKFEKYTLEK